MHGDFHLGQVLVVQSDAYLIDFEGEPARTMEQRRAKQCADPGRGRAAALVRLRGGGGPARPGGGDAGGDRPPGGDPAAVPRRRGAAFLDAYRAVLAAAPVKWVAPQAEAAMLDLFLLEKAAYEIRYEAANRPTWIGIPLQGLYTIAARLLNLPPEGDDA